MIWFYLFILGVVTRTAAGTCLALSRCGAPRRVCERIDELGMVISLHVTSRGGVKSVVHAVCGFAESRRVTYPSNAVWVVQTEGELGW